jgi:hypothetical protein
MPLTSGLPNVSVSALYHKFFGLCRVKSVPVFRLLSAAHRVLRKARSKPQKGPKRSCSKHSSSHLRDATTAARPGMAGRVPLSQCEKLSDRGTRSSERRAKNMVVIYPQGRGYCAASAVPVRRIPGMTRSTRGFIFTRSSGAARPRAADAYAIHVELTAP